MARKGLREERSGKEEYLKGHIRECNRRGISQAEYCHRQKLSPKSFTYWKSRLRKKASVSFVPVQIKPAFQIPAEQTTGVVLYKDDYRIEIWEGFKREVLGEVLRTLREL